MSAPVRSIRGTDSIFCDINDFHPRRPEYLIHGYIETPATGMAFGPTGGGKSFVALDWGLCVATGTPWEGNQVQQGPVIYICGEGRNGIPRRVAAWKKHRGVDVPRNSFFLTNSRLEISKEGYHDLKSQLDLIATAAGNPALIIIDTLARSLPADADENSAKDIQAWINCIDDLRDSYQCVILIVHHTGHGDSQDSRARGSSALKAAMDFEVRVDKKSGCIACTKQKDGPEWPPVSFEIIQIDVTPEWGSGAVAYEFLTPAQAACATGCRADMLATLAGIMAANAPSKNPKDGVSTLKEWRALAYECDTFKGQSDRNRQRKFKTEMQNILKEGYFRLQKDETITGTEHLAKYAAAAGEK